MGQIFGAVSFCIDKSAWDCRKLRDINEKCCSDNPQSEPKSRRDKDELSDFMDNGAISSYSALMMEIAIDAKPLGGNRG
ncbi:unnamed protein product, partial [Mesorhabditis spiculigera]